MAAASRKEEERNERVVRGLLKLPPNRRCVNCDGLGPQYVCTSFWTFICVSCSGIHREFTHRVKSVSMSTFSTQEVEALQKGGNQRAKESFLKDFDTQKMRLPDSSNSGSLRDFIKAVYVERRYAGGRFSERPPRDKQNQKAHEEEHRRPNSYHSFSQSPPYDYQYEEGRNGKRSAFLSRKPGSDKGHQGKISGFCYSSHSLHQRMSRDGFTVDVSAPLWYKINQMYIVLVDSLVHRELYRQET
ncbi:putative ADP-ribosylation factor GTPase-activating protein AGD14 [Zea mays]|uniref:Putative ADP-ribosylation factor GTPase-activating protein AGD14 n=1 Tax=Zea mays TaxID=4577 RepID=A0A1D6K166_MAIZE|nr:putative ADP-ribosylation factor GTPase-activating protein AGD14 [Zea mays]